MLLVEIPKLVIVPRIVSVPIHFVDFPVYLTASSTVAFNLFSSYDVSDFPDFVDVKSRYNLETLAVVYATWVPQVHH